MKLDRRLNSLDGTRRRGFSKYRVCIERDGETYDAKMAWEKVTFVKERMQEIKDAIADELYELYNTTWESLGKLTPARFLKKIRLTSIVISPDGSSTAWFEDGGLFLGHDIEVRVSNNGEIKAVGLAG